MSIKVMVAIWYTEFRDLPTGEDNEDGKPKMAKASSCKSVLLAIADQGNDEGEGSYPGLTRLELKTALSRQGIVDVQKALKYNGLLSVADIPSKLHTNNYRINLSCFPRYYDDDTKILVVKPLDQSSHLTSASQVALPVVVKPLDLKHTINQQESSLTEEEIKQATAKADAILAGGKPLNEITACNAFESAFGITRPWEWFPDTPADKKKTWKDFREYITKLYTADPECFTKYFTWSQRQYVKGSMTGLGIKRNPQDFPDSWAAYCASAMYRKTDETKGTYTVDENGIPETY